MTRHSTRTRSVMTVMLWSSLGRWLEVLRDPSWTRCRVRAEGKKKIIVDHTAEKRNVKMKRGKNKCYDIHDIRHASLHVVLVGSNQQFGHS